jgi:hypothetical protein
MNKEEFENLVYALIYRINATRPDDYNEKVNITDQEIRNTINKMFKGRD